MRMTGNVASLQDLVAINLRYDAGAEALHVRAVAQLVAKVLFAGGKGVSRTAKDLSKEGASVLSVRKIAMAIVETALAFLPTRGLAREYKGRWQLTDNSHVAIESDVLRAEKRLAGVLDRHFPRRIDQLKLRSWF